MPKPSVAIIGLEASGKTVLMTVLAKRLSQSIQNGYFLDPVGNRTIKYIENTWETLQGGDWPPSTAPGEMFNLQWKMRVSPGFAQNSEPCEAEVHLVDAAGQDMRQLFSNDIPLNEVPEYLQPLAQYFAQASILLVLINIKDYIGESDISRKTENQAAIKSALDVLQQGNRRIAFVFTQMDQYGAYIANNGGLTAFCEKYLPYVYNAYMANQKNAVLSVAAVNDTEIRETTDGFALRVPVRDFSSAGLEQVGNWLAKQVVELCQEENALIAIEQEKQRQLAIKAERAQRQEEENRRRAQQAQASVQNNAKDNSGCGCTFLIVILIVVGIFLFTQENGCRDTVKDFAGQTKFIPEPEPKVLDKDGHSTCNTGIWDCWSHNAVTSAVIYNPGKEGNFSVTAKLFVNGQERYSKTQSVYLPRNGSERCTFNFTNINFCASRTQWNYSITAERGN